MDDLLSATQGDKTQQQQVSESTLRSLKEIFLSLPAEAKDSVSIKKAMQGDWDWATNKEILGWIVNTNEGTLRLSPKRKAELGTLLDIPPSQRRISTKKLERLIGKLRSMHLAVPGAVGHFYNLQQSQYPCNAFLMLTESLASAGREGKISLRDLSVSSETRCCCFMSACVADRSSSMYTSVH